MNKVIFWGLMILACIICPLWVIVLVVLWWLYNKLY